MTDDYSTAPAPTNLVADNEWVKAAPEAPAETEPIAEAPADEAEPIAEAPAEAELATETTAAPEPFMLDVQTAPSEALAEPLAAEPEPPAKAPVEEELVVVGLPPISLNLDALVESLLFVADGATPVTRLAEALEVKPHEVEAALERLTALYAERGLSLQRIKDKVQLTSAPAAAAQVQRFLGLSATSPLSKAALETLAIIAYQQPITRPQIEAVRGVNSDSVIKNLLTKGLVEENGRTEGPGRPTLYSTTPEFLQHFGLTSLAELPPLNLDGLRRDAAMEILKG